MKAKYTQDELYMRRALELAQLGQGNVSPNPMVGCVIVCDDKIVGEGWHKKYGESHAEVNAVNSVQDKSTLAKSTVYVTLEPCSHYGKTPPCADLLIRERIKKVVIANLDSNPLVSGEGMKKLKAAGIEIITGVLEKEARELNKRFFTFIEKKRPFVMLKWAQTSDGFIARENFDSKWISNDFSRQLVHKWRSEEDAILVGSGTVHYDDPSLNVRNWTGRNPLRIVLDRSLKLKEGLQLFDQSQPTIRYNTIHQEDNNNLFLVKVEKSNFLMNVLHDLNSRKIQSVIVEGGSHVLNAFIESGIWDEARIFVAPVTFGKGISAPALTGELSHEMMLGSDTLKIYKR